MQWYLEQEAQNLLEDTLESAERIRETRFQVGQSAGSQASIVLTAVGGHQDWAIVWGDKLEKTAPFVKATICSNIREETRMIHKSGAMFLKYILGRESVEDLVMWLEVVECRINVDYWQQFQAVQLCKRAAFSATYLLSANTRP